MEVGTEMGIRMIMDTTIRMFMGMRTRMTMFMDTATSTTISKNFTSLFSGLIINSHA